MKNRSYRFIRNLPLTKKERAQARHYRQVPLSQKLDWLDRMRAFTFDLWKHNPSIYKAHQKFRLGEV